MLQALGLCGCCGAERIYVGDICMGVCCLCTGGCCGVGWCLDFCLIGNIIESQNNEIRARAREGHNQRLQAQHPSVQLVQPQIYPGSQPTQPLYGQPQQQQQYPQQPYGNQYPPPQQQQYQQQYPDKQQQPYVYSQNQQQPNYYPAQTGSSYPPPGLPAQDDQSGFVAPPDYGKY
ncbi:MAG: hypothetical protein EZS28_048581 [Streblomastix strix]|uniref:TM2 domain-containing protein n=1 Tax=Streblomastix strix TaxID=222440 RepID=A0A5J4TD70_9EUKA|nr:MAG: hypothetical protein EZS28_048581 [Streblomastix strix]